MFEAITLTFVFHFLLVFSRVGTAIMLLPGIGEGSVFSRARLLFAVGVVLSLVIVLEPILPKVPVSIILLILLIAGEFLIGLFIGTIARMILSTTHTAGMMISHSMGLAAAMMFDPSQGSQGSVIGNFLTALVLLLIFVSGLHHIFLLAVADSYQVFFVSEPIPVQDFSEYVSRLLSSVFVTSFKIASPHMVIGLAVYLGAGVMGRLMPQMHVFFVLIPIQIVLGFVILMLTLSAIMMWYMDYFAEHVGAFIL